MTTTRFRVGPILILVVCLVLTAILPRWSNTAIAQESVTRISIVAANAANKCVSDLIISETDEETKQNYWDKDLLESRAIEFLEVSWDGASANVPGDLLGPYQLTAFVYATGPPSTRICHYEIKNEPFTLEGNTLLLADALRFGDLNSSLPFSDTVEVPFGHATTGNTYAVWWLIWIDTSGIAGAVDPGTYQSTVTITAGPDGP